MIETDIVAEDIPEFLSLLNSLQIQVNDSSSHINSLYGNIKNDNILREEGLSFLEMKSHLFLEYLINITYSMLLKVDGTPIVNQPCIERLTEIRTVLEKIRPINKKLNYQIDKLVKMAAENPVQSNQHPLSFKPNLDNLVQKGEEESESEAENVEANDVYVPPKVTAVPYDDDSLTKQDKKLKKSRQRSLNSALLHDLRSEYSEAPEEIRNERQSNKRTRIKEKEEERQRFEEDNLRRLTLTKKDKMQRRQLNDLDEIVKLGGFHSIDADDDSDDDGKYKPALKKKKFGRQIKSKFNKRMQRRKR